MRALSLHDAVLRGFSNGLPMTVKTLIATTIDELAGAIWSFCCGLIDLIPSVVCRSHLTDLLRLKVLNHRSEINTCGYSLSGFIGAHRWFKNGRYSQPCVVTD